MVNQIIAHLGKTGRTHNCNGCEKKLYGKNKGRVSNVSPRVKFLGGNYCIPCGYKRAENLKEQMEKLISELKDKHGKELVVSRLTRK